MCSDKFSLKHALKTEIKNRLGYEFTHKLRHYRTLLKYRNAETFIRPRSKEINPQTTPTKVFTAIMVEPPPLVEKV